MTISLKYMEKKISMTFTIPNSEERIMKDFLWPILQIVLMAVGIYSVLLGLYWYFVAV